MDRHPYVAGAFYPDNRQEIELQLERFFRAVPRAEAAPAVGSLLAMVPHAGWMYSGAICAATLAAADLPSTLVILGPNHTGMGAPCAVWPSGNWLLPESSLPVDTELATRIIDSHSAFTADSAAHIREHSLEVLLPFLQYNNPDLKIVPVAVGETRPEVLMSAGKALASVIQSSEERVGIVVSSDMSHFITAEQARRSDEIALKALRSLDPLFFFETVISSGITMCGVLPMTMALSAINILGGKQVEIVSYGNSGDVSGDFSEVVGYAGVLIR